MPQKSETPREGGVSRNSCAGCFRVPLTLCPSARQGWRDLISLHLGYGFCAAWPEREDKR